MKVTAKIRKKRAPRPPSRAARMLALAHHVELMVESGTVKGYEEIATKLSLSRARIAQLTNLLNLSPRIQEGV